MITGSFSGRARVVPGNSHCGHGFGAGHRTTSEMDGQAKGGLRGAGGAGVYRGVELDTPEAGD